MLRKLPRRQSCSRPRRLSRSRRRRSANRPHSRKPASTASAGCKEEAKAGKSGGLPDFAKCDAKLGLKWPAIETKGGGSCPSNGDQLPIRAFVDQHTDDLAVALGGGVLPDCGGELATCEAELASGTATPVGQLLQTGQATCYDASGNILDCTGTSPDGEHEIGLSAAYVNNGDGTISDGRTGLMWEKLGNDGSIHDRDNLCSWTAAFTRIAQLNADAFAGHTDWRLPNRSELLSSIRVSATEPSVHPAFSTACTAACSATACSCTLADSYLSSSTFEPFPSLAWLVDFRFGAVTQADKMLTYPVRAVRSGM